MSAAGPDLLGRRLLGRHVLRRARDHAGGRQAGRGLEDLRDAEVREVDTAVVVEQHVRRLHVAVDDALAVRVVERVGHAAQDRDGARERQPLAPDQRGQRAARDQAHRHPGDALFAVDVVGVDRHDVRVLEARDRLGLASRTAARSRGRAGTRAAAPSAPRSGRGPPRRPCRRTPCRRGRGARRCGTGRQWIRGRGPTTPPRARSLPPRTSNGERD